MTITIIQNGLYAFDGIYICNLTEGTRVVEHDRLPLHFTKNETLLITAQHMEQLINEGWAGASGGIIAGTVEVASGTFAPLPELTEANAAEEKVSEPIEEKQEEPAAENKAVDPVLETKPLPEAKARSTKSKK